MPKLLPKNYQIEQRWIDKAKELLPGEELFLPAENKAEQTKRIKVMRELLDKLSRDEPITANSIVVERLYRDRALWIHIRMLERSPLAGYIKGKDGNVRRVSIAIDPERRRKIKLMLADGLPIEEIDIVLDAPMTRAEKREFIEKGRLL